MEKCVIDLFSAITQVSPLYFNAIGTRYNEEQYHQVTENPFTAELYHRFKYLTEQKINEQYYINLILHFDITKASVNRRPDLVLHQGQENRNDQRMFIEIKTDANVSLTDDFNKLIQATDEYLNFKNVVMITVNRKFSDLLNLITVHSEFFNLQVERANRIYFFNIDSSQELPQYEIYSLRYNKKINARIL